MFIAELPLCLFLRAGWRGYTTNIQYVHVAAAEALCRLLREANELVG